MFYIKIIFSFLHLRTRKYVYILMKFWNIRDKKNSQVVEKDKTASHIERNLYINFTRIPHHWKFENNKTKPPKF